MENEHQVVVTSGGSGWKYYAILLGAGTIAGGVCYYYYYKKDDEKESARRIDNDDLTVDFISSGVGRKKKDKNRERVNTFINAKIPFVQAYEITQKMFSDNDFLGWFELVNQKKKEKDFASYVNLHVASATIHQEIMELDDNVVDGESRSYYEETIYKVTVEAQRYIQDLRSTEELAVTYKMLESALRMYKISPGEEYMNSIYVSSSRILYICFQEDIQHCNFEYIKEIPTLMSRFRETGRRLDMNILPHFQVWLKICESLSEKVQKEVIHPIIARLKLLIAESSRDKEQSLQLLDEVAPHLGDFSFTEKIDYHKVRESCYYTLSQKEKAVKHQKSLMDTSATLTTVDRIENVLLYDGRKEARKYYDKVIQLLTTTIRAIKSNNFPLSNESIPELYKLIRLTINAFGNYKEVLELLNEMLSFTQNLDFEGILRDGFIDFDLETFMFCLCLSLKSGQTHTIKKTFENFVRRHSNDLICLAKKVSYIPFFLVSAREEKYTIEIIPKIINSCGSSKKHILHKVLLNSNLARILFDEFAQTKKAAQILTSTKSRLLANLPSLDMYQKHDRVKYNIIIDLQSILVDLCSGQLNKSNALTAFEATLNTIANEKPIGDKPLIQESAFVNYLIGQVHRVLGENHKAIKISDKWSSWNISSIYNHDTQMYSLSACELYALNGDYGKIQLLVELLAKMRQNVLMDPAVNGYGLDLVLIAIHRDYGDDISDQVEEFARNLAEKVTVECRGRSPLGLWNQWLNFAEILLCKGKHQQSEQWLNKVKQLLDQDTAKEEGERDRNMEMRVKIRGARMWNEMKNKQEATNWIKGARAEASVYGNEKDEIEVIALEAAINMKTEQVDLDRIKQLLGRDEQIAERRWRGMCWRDIAESFEEQEEQEEETNVYWEKAEKQFEGLGQGWNKRFAQKKTSKKLVKK